MFGRQKICNSINCKTEIPFEISVLSFAKWHIAAYYTFDLHNTEKKQIFSKTLMQLVLIVVLFLL